VTCGSREELAELLATEDPETLRRRAVLLDAADAEHPMSGRLVKQRFAQLKQLYRATAAGDVALNDSVVAEVASALCDHRVRDACLPWCSGSGAVAAERLWLALVRATPAPERAEPAALLALTAYFRGDGALAGVALDAAQQACPHHSLSGLLRAALDGGLPPELLRGVARDAAAALRRRACPQIPRTTAATWPVIGSDQCVSWRVSRANCQASAMITARSQRSSFQPSSARARSLEAISTAGSPGRRTARCAGIGCPVICRQVSSTCRTEKPVPLPRLKMRCCPGMACSSARS
jgi:hypothetical protein